MVIDNTLTGIFNAMIKNKNNWIYVSDKQKEEFSFIINRYMSRRYLQQSLLMNTKGIDKALVLDLWYYFMLDKPYPSWFWSKNEKKEKNSINDSEITKLIRHFQIKKEDVIYLVENHYDFIKEEIDWLKKIEKNNL